MGEQARAETPICGVDMPDVAPELVSEQEMLVSFTIQQCPHKSLAYSLAAFCEQSEVCTSIRDDLFIVAKLSNLLVKHFALA